MIKNGVSKICSDVIIRDGNGNVKTILPQTTLKKTESFSQQGTRHENWIYNRLCRFTKKARIHMQRQTKWFYDKTFYLTDIYIPKARLVIEVDGNWHNAPQQQKKDAARDKFFNDKGIRVIRIPNINAENPLKEKTVNSITNIIRSQIAKLHR